MNLYDLDNSKNSRKKNIREGLADEFMAMAKAKGMNPRLAGTPEQEKQRTADMMAQRAKDREAQAQQSAQADASKLPELKAEYAEMKAKYEALGGNNWQYADREQNLSDREREARSMEPALNRLGARIAAAEKSQGVAEDSLNEFAPPGSNDGDDGFSEETLKMLAAQWYNGNEDPRIEKALMAAGWEIGQDEGYDDEPGVFVVQAGDVNGNSYLSWPAHELKQGMSEGTQTVGHEILGMLRQVKRQGDDAMEELYSSCPLLAQFWDQYEGDFRSLVVELSPKTLHRIKAEISAFNQQGMSEGSIMEYDRSLAIPAAKSLIAALPRMSELGYTQEDRACVEKFIKLLQRGDTHKARRYQKRGGCTIHASNFIDEILSDANAIPDANRQPVLVDPRLTNKFNFNPDDNWSQDFETRMSKGVAEGTDDLRDSVLDVLKAIYNGSSSGEYMIDTLADEFGQYYDEVEASGDQSLQNAYSFMMDNGQEADGDPQAMAQIAKQAISMLTQGVAEGQLNELSPELLQRYQDQADATGDKKRMQGSKIADYKLGNRFRYGGDSREAKITARRDAKQAADKAANPQQSDQSYGHGGFDSDRNSIKFGRTYNESAEGVAEGNDGFDTHIVMVTVSDPGHQAVTQRGETKQRRCRVRADDRESAVNTAIKWYRKQGYKVHDHHYVGAIRSGATPRNEDTGLNELSNELLGRYKKELGVRASAADKAGDYDKGHEYFKKINKATIRQGENDARKHERENQNEMMETRLNMMRKAGYDL